MAAVLAALSQAMEGMRMKLSGGEEKESFLRSVDPSQSEEKPPRGLSIVR
jgi:hypothetical protein